VNRVYFFGAGLSKAINSDYPTLVELSEIVFRSFAARHEGTAVMNHFGTLPAQLRGNLELFLSYLFSDWPWKTTAEQDLDLSLYRHLTHEICVHLGQIETKEVDEELQEFIRYLRFHEHGIVTLNYDTLVESLAARFWRTKTGIVQHNYGLLYEDVSDDVRRTSEDLPYVIEDREPGKLDWRIKQVRVDRKTLLQDRGEEIATLIANDPALQPKALGFDREKMREQLSANFALLKMIRPSGYEDPKDSTTLRNRIMKLHGSIDWKDDGSDTVRIPGTGASRARKATLPLIVPPLLDKTKHYGTEKIRDAWFNAHSLLEQADEVIVAGFSFPPTDLSVRYLFQSAMRSNARARVVVVNRDYAAGLRPNYDQVFFQPGGGAVDYQYCGRDDSLKAYVRAEIIRS
jgi:hypothetical protein